VNGKSEKEEGKVEGIDTIELPTAGYKGGEIQGKPRIPPERVR